MYSHYVLLYYRGATHRAEVWKVIVRSAKMGIDYWKIKSGITKAKLDVDIVETIETMSGVKPKRKVATKLYE